MRRRIVLLWSASWAVERPRRLLSTNAGSDLQRPDAGRRSRTTRRRSIPTPHALVTVPGKPLQFISGGDGGVVRGDGKYVDISAKCGPRGLNPETPGAVPEPAQQRARTSSST